MNVYVENRGLSSWLGSILFLYTLALGSVQFLFVIFPTLAAFHARIPST